MTILIEDVELEHLAERIARAEGMSVTEVVRESLLSLADQRGMDVRQQPLRERLAALAREVDALPPRLPADTRKDEEILGYNEHGAW